MKRKLFSTAILLCCVAICLAAIAELSGKWIGVIKTGDGNDIPLTYLFKVDGEKLTGSITSDQTEMPMYEGKINGNDFSFKVDVNGTPVTNTGKFYGDSVAVDALLRVDK
jgi:myo-inositol-hexaphosphate 3-phosphohydrolase